MYEIPSPPVTVEKVADGRMRGPRKSRPKARQPSSAPEGEGTYALECSRSLTR